MGGNTDGDMMCMEKGGCVRPNRESTEGRDAAKVMRPEREGAWRWILDGPTH